MKQLIVNADDFGMAPGINRAIVQAHRTGIVTSTSLLANGAAFDDAATSARANPTLAVGVHLNLTEGLPLSDPAKLGALVNASGEFIGSPEALFFRMVTGRVALDAAEREFRAQIDRIFSAGICPTHLDGHQHVHMWPPMFSLTARLAAEYGMAGVRSSRERRVDFPGLWRRNAPVRGKILLQAGVGLGLAFLAVASRAALSAAGVATPDYFYGVSSTGYLDRGTLEDVLRDVPDGVSELMCHPGYVDAALERVETRLVRQRETELEAVAGPEARNLVERFGIQLVSYRALAAPGAARKK
ncbi:MAG TPA: ChbG/HpnK family deacetylase [Candidatus Acidoferrales bacterium]|nr:ChbG/HpnK family deacetylase [Candidatus Acidoferrales bacterium]